MRTPPHSKDKFESWLSVGIRVCNGFNLFYLYCENAFSKEMDTEQKRENGSIDRQCQEHPIIKIKAKPTQPHVLRDTDNWISLWDLNILYSEFPSQSIRLKRQSLCLSRTHQGWQAAKLILSLEDSFERPITSWKQARNSKVVKIHSVNKYKNVSNSDPVTRRTKRSRVVLVALMAFPIMRIAEVDE